MVFVDAYTSSIRYQSGFARGPRLCCWVTTEDNCDGTTKSRRAMVICSKSIAASTAAARLVCGVALALEERGSRNVAIQPNYNFSGQNINISVKIGPHFSQTGKANQCMHSQGSMFSCSAIDKYSTNLSILAIL
jgi:hypothetical protein